MKKEYSTFLAVAAISLAPVTISAQEVTLRAISAFQPGTVFYEPFQSFVDNVNAEGAGLVRIHVIGGPDAMPPFEIGNALRAGVVDLANTTAVYHANLVPEGLAMTLTNHSMAELRENGGYALMDEIHMEKANIHWLGRLTQNIQYHIYLAAPPESPDFAGLRIRSAPTYQAFFSGIGINPMQTAAGEVYTALERGAIDGYAWPTIGVFDLGWQEKTAARVDPGFYQVETGIYLSGATMAALTEDQADFLRAQMLSIESDAARFETMAAEEIAKQQAAGVATYQLPEADASAFVASSVDEGWKPVLAASPEHGETLRVLFAD
ncbi:MAG: TRAP transporter substrate-binding protein DctP [Loktanella sp.]|nr:TRAP transporter substrate-binding protein DctP [Loktanella sp.]